ncbi:hypothetical protein SAMD00019534_054760, partial [Acytostelium subglobosum LB1]|uniref:hypothetical protein n=1 Tax=Acytostelium subglobosum LB1 TaxID=1410327 RepID=UPI0006448242
MSTKDNNILVLAGPSLSSNNDHKDKVLDIEHIQCARETPNSSSYGTETKSDQDENEQQQLEPSFEKNDTHDITFLLPIQDIIDSSGDADDAASSQQSFDKIYAHRHIVQTHSEYFRILLTNGMRESTQQEITIPNIPTDVFYNILQFLYTSKLDINEDNINNIYLVCDQLLLDDGKQLCRSHVQSMDNAILEKLLYGTDIICTELNNLFIDQAVANATYFLQEERVAKLTRDMLLGILQKEDMPMKEVEIFKSTATWIKADIGYPPPTDDDGVSSLAELFNYIRFPTMEWEELSTVVEPTKLVPTNLLVEAYRHLSKPKNCPLAVCDANNLRLMQRKKIDPPMVPGVEVYRIPCTDHANCASVSWTISNFSLIKTQKHISNTFEIMGLRWRMWSYPAGEAKHSDSFSVYLEAIRVKERESFDFLRNTTFFFSLVNHKDMTLTKEYPSSPNVLFNYDKSVWGNGLIELKQLYDPALGFIDNDTVTIQLHILECLALE